MKYRADIDGLRAISVIAVIIYHAEFFISSDSLLLSGGYLGVDVFFVISGYLISYLIIEEYQTTQRFSFLYFYQRRIRRILPVLFSVILCCLPFAWYLMLPTQLIDFSQSIQSVLLFVSNIFFYFNGTEYGAESSLLKPLLHTWSLSIEEQFYLFFPIILIVLTKFFNKHIIILLCSFFLTSLGLAHWLSDHNVSLAFYMIYTRAWELILGTLIALFHYHNKFKITNKIADVVSITGLIMLLVGLFIFSKNTQHPSFLTMLPVIGVSLIIMYGNNQGISQRILSNGLFVKIGLLSYSLYLWHYPVFAFFRLYDLNVSFFDKICLILLTILLAVISYSLIEKPFRYKDKLSNKMVYSYLIALFVMLNMFSFIVVKYNGLPKRLGSISDIYQQNEADNMLLEYLSLEWISQRTDTKKSSPFRYFLENKQQYTDLYYDDNDRTENVMIFGNSHARDLHNALYQNRALFPEYDFIVYLAQIWDLEDEVKVNRILNSPNFIHSDVIVISSRFGYVLPREDIKGDYQPFNRQAIETWIELFQQAGKKVVLTSSTPEFNYINDRPIFDYYVRANQSEQIDVNKLNNTFYDNLDPDVFERNVLLKEIADNYQIPFLNKFDYVCELEQQFCHGITPDLYKIFHDYGHYTLEGAQYFGEIIHNKNWFKTSIN